MPVNLYECMFLLDTNKAGNDVEAMKAKLHSTLERYSAEILASRPWGEDRKLAYPIKGQKKGLYYLIYFRMESTKMQELENDFRINESILRHLVIYIEPKLEEAMLAVARDEQALALHAMSNDDTLDAELGLPEEEGRRGSGGGRRATGVGADKM